MICGCINHNTTTKNSKYIQCCNNLHFREILWDFPENEKKKKKLNKLLVVRIENVLFFSNICSMNLMALNGITGSVRQMLIAGNGIVDDDSGVECVIMIGFSKNVVANK